MIDTELDMEESQWMDERTFHQCMLRNGVGAIASRIESETSLYSNFERARSNLNDAATCLEKVCLKYQGVNITIPRISAAHASDSRFGYERTLRALNERLEDGISAMDEALADSGMPQIKWHSPNTATYEFFESRTFLGVLRRRKDRTTHTHEIVKAKGLRYPAKEVEKPERALELLSELTPTLRQACRIVVGMMVAKGSEVTDTTHEATRLGRAVNAVGRGLARARDAAFTKAREAQEFYRPSVPLQTNAFLARDPAIAIGQYVLYGWVSGNK